MVFNNLVVEFWNKTYCNNRPNENLVRIDSFIKEKASKNENNVKTEFNYESILEQIQVKESLEFGTCFLLNNHFLEKEKDEKKLIKNDKYNGRY